MSDIATFYNTLTKGCRCLFRDTALRVCGWSVGTFYYKLHHGNFSPLEHDFLTTLVESFNRDILWRQ